MAAAAEALELIYARNAPQAACAVASHEFEHEEASRPKDNPICIVGGMGADAGHRKTRCFQRASERPCCGTRSNCKIADEWHRLGGTDRLHQKGYGSL